MVVWDSKVVQQTSKTQNENIYVWGVVTQVTPTQQHQHYFCLKI